MIAFINDNAIESVAFDALKMKMKDHTLISRAMREANESDIMDYDILRLSVGTEILRGVRSSSEVKKEHGMTSHTARR
jgi:hypothetical protein